MTTCLVSGSVRSAGHEADVGEEVTDVDSAGASGGRVLQTGDGSRRIESPVGDRCGGRRCGRVGQKAPAKEGGGTDLEGRGRGQHADEQQCCHGLAAVGVAPHAVDLPALPTRKYRVVSGPTIMGVSSRGCCNALLWVPLTAAVQNEAWTGSFLPDLAECALIDNGYYFRLSRRILKHIRPK